MKPHDQTPDEEPIASVLGAADTDAAPPDADFLTKLKTQSTEAFTAAATQKRFRRRAAWLGAMAAAIAIGVGLYFWLAPGSSGIALGQALENTQRVGTLHLQFDLAGKKGEFWHATTTKQSRWDDLNGNYRIADGGKFWVVNESANSAFRAEPPPFVDRPVSHFLEMLGVSADQPAILKARPIERIGHIGAATLVYRTEIPSRKGPNLHLEAHVDCKTLTLKSIRTWFDKDGKIEPIGELTMLAYEPIAADKFAIADTLTEDGRIGKVADVQGIVAIKPVLAERWTPVHERLVLKPGDWLRTDDRGANAVEARLVKNTRVILGPKTLVEFISPTKLNLINGDIEIVPAKGSTIELLWHGHKQYSVKDRQMFIARPGFTGPSYIAHLEKDPPWLLGFKGATANESLGSLVALVDGRNVPLTVGYHKVTVDIRDQIARTVIEESFVNHTDAVLEGVFHFPLPADASISGFGMWIGDKLVEADVVEKQRAREIYETILREKRDPGLLEWSGGSIFKARVYPIPANAEKRIKITYTQVLPLKGSRYRYSYALQSELLQQHPLRELNIDVKVNSVTPLKSVTSPTHPTRDAVTSHCGHVEFTAQGYTPTRDFEVVVEQAGQPSSVVMIPHRRGDDGYFMLQLTPPGMPGDWERPLLPNGDPVHLLILADTSASIDAGQRATQATFIGSLLAALSPKDTFNLAACDVATIWTFAKPMPADATNVTAARDFLAKRTSLGWTDLDDAFASALKQCGPHTHVIYVGDGIVTKGDADPIAFTKRLRLLLPSPSGRGAGGEGARQPSPKEAVGWVERTREAHQHLQLLGGPREYARPTLQTSLKSKTPSPPAPLPGREGRNATFHAITLGSGSEPAVMKAIAALGSGSMRKITSEQGPAVVARDLLAEIAQPALRDIRVEFKGIKAARVYPESLANVPAGTQQILMGRYLPRRAEPRKGPGNDHIDDQAGEVIVTGTQAGKPVRFSTRVTLKDAELGNSFIPRLWARMHLDSLLEQGSSDAIKDEIISLSEEYQIITPYTSLLVLETDADRERFKVKRRFLMRDGERFFADGRDNAIFDLAQKQMQRAAAWRTALRREVMSELAGLGRDVRFFQARPRLYNGQLGMIGGRFVQSISTGGITTTGVVTSDWDGIDGLAGVPNLGLSDEGEAPHGEYSIGLALAKPLGYRVDLDQAKKLLQQIREEEPEFSKATAGEPWNRDTKSVFQPVNSPVIQGSAVVQGSLLEVQEEVALLLPSFDQGRRGAYREHWTENLFPPLAAVPDKQKEPKSKWPAAARDLAKSLLRTEQLAKMKDGIEIVRQSDTFDPRWGELTGRSRRLELVATQSWLTRSTSDGGQTLVAWCDAKEIGVFSRAFQLGRVRASTPLDVQPPPLSLEDASLVSLERSFASSKATVEPQGKDRTLLVLKTRRDETRFLIDTARHVILSQEDRYDGKVISTTRFDDFVEVAGSWWAQRVETLDDADKRISLVTLTIKSMPLAELEKQTKAELADHADVQFLHLPMPSVAKAKKAFKDGKAGFDDHFILMLHFERSQQWPRVLDHLQQAEKLAGAKPGLRWLRSALLYDSRRHDELRKRYLEDAARLAKETSADAYYLAEFIVGQSASVLQANEMLTLLDAVKPLYDKQPPHVQARKNWLQLRLSYLDRASRPDEALQAQKQLAADYPRDYDLQKQYARALAAGGDYPAAYAWLTRVLVKESKWLYYEEDELRSAYTQFLEQQGRYADLVKYVAAWVEQNPANRSAYEQYLTALIKTDQIDKADALALRWLKDGYADGEMAPGVDARLSAGINFMLGIGYELRSNRIEERMLPPIAEAALAFAKHEKRAESANAILSNDAFRRGDEGRRVRKALADFLLSGIDKLPAEHVQRLVGWVQAEPSAWTKIAVKLQERWTKEPKDDVKHTLGLAIIDVLNGHGKADELTTFLRLQHQKGPADKRTAYANQLFDDLIAQPWSAANEAEAIGLLDKLGIDGEPRGLTPWLTSIAALHRLTDAMIESRIQARMKLVVHPEKLTRTELMKKQDEARKSVREGLADDLRKAAATQPKPLARWLIAESVYLDVTLDRNLKLAAGEAWELLDAAPPKRDVETMLDEVLRQRYLITLMNLAARKGAEPAMVDRLVKYLDKQIADHADEPRWKVAKSRLFIALDRPKELEAAYRQWTRGDDPDNRWRLALGYLLAEQNRLPEAIVQFEAVEADDELSPVNYRSLADWYLLQNQRDKHERAMTAIYETMPEDQLSQLIRRMPNVQDKELLRMFAVLFNKSVTPQQYLGQVQELYQHSHDFHLLAGLPDAVVGHTAERVYPFVQGMKPVLDEVRDEATADEIVKRIAEVRKLAKTPVDRRALDMLEAMVERRAAEIQNQPGPHRDKALAALVRASKGEWSKGEPRLMADYLASLGKITQPALADEQLRQLNSLHKETPPGSLDRLHVAHQHAALLNGYQRRNDALDRLESALAEYQAANKDVLPVAANDALGTYLGILGDAGQFARGEKALVAHIAQPANAEQRRWLVARLDELYLRALRADGEVSLGKGVALYQALNTKILKDLAAPDENQRRQRIGLLCQLYRTAHEKKLAGVNTDLKAFAFEIAPPLFKEQKHDHEEMVGTIAQTVHAVLGPRDGVGFLLNEIEREPRWLRYVNQDGWTRHARTLADWRIEAKDLGDLDSPLLKLVLAELRRDLESREQRNRALYSRHWESERFWKEKADDFAKTAEDVLAKRDKSGQSVEYIADYFDQGLGQPKRAIQIMFAAYKKDLLEEDGQAKLVNFLHREKRFGESIPVLLPLVERLPGSLNYSTLLMRAYHKTDRKADLLALLKQTDAYFHEKDRWGEQPMQTLAYSTLENALFEQSIAYFKEAIPLHERTQPNRGMGNGTLAGYYVGLAKAYAGLKKTPEAVDAACAAIVAWGNSRNNRSQAINTLTAVLVQAPDLDGYVSQFDKQDKDSAIIRKAIGQAYQEKKEHAKAIQQLKRAAELQPNDAEIYQLLIASLDAAGDKDGAVKQLLQAVEHSRRDLKLYEELGKRYAALGQAKEAERAYTSIVEMQPTEAESHALLAEIREKQNRWPDAVHEWQQVARLRALEPTGLLKLAAAQMHAKQWDAALGTLRKLDSRRWPTRFGDVQGQVRKLEAKLTKQRKK